MLYRNISRRKSKSVNWYVVLQNYTDIFNRLPIELTTSRNIFHIKNEKDLQ